MLLLLLFFYFQEARDHRRPVYVYNIIYRRGSHRTPAHTIVIAEESCGRRRGYPLESRYSIIIYTPLYRSSDYRHRHYRRSHRYHHHHRRRRHHHRYNNNNNDSNNNNNNNNTF